MLLDYRAIDATKIEKDLPEVYALGAKYLPYAESLYGEPLQLLEGRLGVNINIVPENGQQGIHVDRNPVTMILYLSTPEGGELEILSGEEPTRIKAEAGCALFWLEEIKYFIRSYR